MERDVTVWVQLRRFMLTPLPGGMRLLDLVVATAITFVVGLPIRLIWDSDWALIAFPLAVVGSYWTQSHVPDEPPSEAKK